MSDIEKEIDNNPVLTRYLYNKPDVMRSLRWALFSQQTDEALFWAYELYYSGFEEETIGFIYEIGTVYYTNARSQFKKTWTQWGAEWVNTKNIDILSTMVLNLCKRQPCLVDSAETRDTFRFIIRCKHSITGRKYETNTDTETGKLSPCKVLPLVSTYSIRIREILAETQETHEEYIERTHDMYLNHWAYYAWKSPIWRKRFESYGASIDDTDKKIVFEDADREEEFMEKWYYEPDEQNIEINNKHGIYYESVEQYSFEEATQIIKEKRI